MSELIKREDAIEAMAELQGIAQSKAELTGISKAWKRIKVLHTVDAVPVVRCGECKYAKDENFISAIWCKNLEKYLAYDFFCADWERRTDETEGS